MCKKCLDITPWVAVLPPVSPEMYVNHSPEWITQFTLTITMCNETLIAHTHTPIKTQWTPLMLNKRIKFCLFAERTICIMPLSKADKRDSVCENYLSPFFMSISISVEFEWNFVNGAHSFHSSASRGNRARNSTTLPLWVTAVMYPIGGPPPPCLTSLLDISIYLRHNVLVSCGSVTIS